uniref:Uncharacterized protein n=1 Tax=Rhizophora mucronata TaxID=61149 RepID=A0A2P2PE55_RHIMU
MYDICRLQIRFTQPFGTNTTAYISFNCTSRTIFSKNAFYNL